MFLLLLLILSWQFIFSAFSEFWRCKESCKSPCIVHLPSQPVSWNTEYISRMFRKAQNNFKIFMNISVTLKLLIKSSDFKMTHQAPSNRFLLFSRLLSVVAHIFCCCDERTDTMCEKNYHLFGRGLVGQ